MFAVGRKCYSAALQQGVRSGRMAVMAPGSTVSTSRLEHIGGVSGYDAPGGRHATVTWAALVGHTIECFDFYIYATTAVLVLPRATISSMPATQSTSPLSR